MRFVNQNDQIMTQNLTKSFVNHRNVGLAPQTVPELALHHAERGFDVRPFVVMRHEFGTRNWK